MELCDRKCNECPLMIHPNARVLTMIFNKAYKKYGKGFYDIIKDCINMSICYDCHIDDFCHHEDCEIIKEITEQAGAVDPQKDAGN